MYSFDPIVDRSVKGRLKKSLDFVKMCQISLSDVVTVPPVPRSSLDGMIFADDFKPVFYVLKLQILRLVILKNQLTHMLWSARYETKVFSNASHSGKQPLFF